jgi:hypothetical protein
MKTLRKEFQDCKITVNAIGVGKIQINTSTTDLETLKSNEIFDFMFERTQSNEPVKIVETAPIETNNVVDTPVKPKSKKKKK